MKTSNLFFIVRRLSFSKRNKGIVHIISLISLIGIAVGTFALIVVLSVFNGFTSVAEKMLEKENPPILISPLQGNSFQYTKDLADIKKMKDVKTVVPVVKQTVLISVHDNQSIVQMIGTDKSYFLYNALDTCIVNGVQTFAGLEEDECVMGMGVALDMGLTKGAEKMGIPVNISVPQNNQDALVPEDMLRTETLFYSASYVTRSELDEGYIFVPIDKARNLLDYSEKDVSELYVVPKDLSKTQSLIKSLKEKIGDKYSVKSLLEQQPVYFRIAKSEKMAVYVILSLIIFIATINIVSTLIILYIQKKKMNYIFSAIGMLEKDLRKIYFNYGMMLNVIGCLIGLVVGVLFCVLQQRFGFIKLAQDSFVVDAFPIKILLWDIIRVVLIVLIIGALSVRIVSKKIKIQ